MTNRPTDNFKTEDRELEQVLSFIEEQFIIAKEDLLSSVLYNYFTQYSHNIMNEDALMLAISYASLDESYSDIFSKYEIKYVKTPPDNVIKDLLLQLPIELVQILLP